MLGFLNRLSDLLFVLARVENRRAGLADVEWLGRVGGSDPFLSRSLSCLRPK